MNPNHDAHLRDTADRSYLRRLASVAGIECQMNGLRFARSVGPDRLTLGKRLEQGAVGAAVADEGLVHALAIDGVAVVEHGALHSGLLEREDEEPIGQA